MLSEGAAGAIGNRAMAMGAPIMQSAMGMLGLDPIQLGLKATMGAWGSGSGVLGAGMAGMGAFAAGGALAAGVGYAGSQIYTGMQQQQNLQQTLRQNYAFQRPGGMGFDTGQMNQIGGTLREMTHQFGPGGEVTGFRELTQLAGKMGQMGMAQGVRDAQEFSKKFKEMVTTLKTMATTLGTTLEGAMEFAQAAKGSGVFGMRGAQQFSAAARGAASAGGLALSEVTSMANIGSQISRSVGGLGRAGALGGIKTIAQIGVAQQMGILSEEDIYNATGLEGAAGRQAMATRQMEQSAGFLKTGKGRWALASIAGKDGTVDLDAVQEYISGGVSTARTQQRAHQNLSGIGRANFLRNEGHLRGQALEKLGGLAMPVALAGWLAQKGYDPSNMDDKAMLAFTRFSGMGQDEATDAIKMVRNLPALLEKQAEREKQDQYNTQLSQQRSTRGIEGAKKRLEQVREKLQGGFQEVGQHIMVSGTEMIERWLNKLTDRYEIQTSETMNTAVKEILGGKDSKNLDALLAPLKNERFMEGAKKSGLLPGVSVMDSAKENTLDKMGLTLGKSGASQVTELQGMFSTAGERREAYVDSLRGKGSGSKNRWGAIGTAALVGGGVGAVAGAAAGFGIGAAPGWLVGAAVGGGIALGAAVFGGMFGYDDNQQNLGSFIEDEKTHDLIKGIHSASGEVRDKTRAHIDKEITGLQDKQKKEEKLGKEDSAKLEGLQLIAAGDDLMKLRTQYPQGIPAAVRNKFEKEHGGMSIFQANEKLEGMRGVVVHAAGEKIATSLRQVSDTAKETAGKLSEVGVYDAKTGSLTAGFKKDIGKTGVKGAADMMSMLASSLTEQTHISGESKYLESDAGTLKAAGGIEADFRKRFGSLSVADQRKMAEAARESGAGTFADAMGTETSKQEQIDNRIKKHGMSAAASDLLGLDSKDKKLTEDLKNAGDNNLKRAAVRAKALGIDPQSLAKEDQGVLQKIEDYQTAIKTGKTGLAKDLLADIKTNEHVKKFESDKTKREQEEKTTKRREDDPVQANIEKNTVKMTTALEAIAKKTVGADQWAQILAAGKDTEKK
jgi:hypothetical protein